MTLSTVGTSVITTHHAVEDIVGGPTGADVMHRQRISLWDARLGVDATLSRRLGVALSLPLRLLRTSIRYLEDDSGAQVDIAGAGIHHRDETLTGLGDAELSARVPWRLGAWRLEPRVGLTLPTGRIEANPFDDDDERHQHVQFGTGTWNPVLAVDAEYAATKWHAGGYASATLMLKENALGYRAGHRFSGGLAVGTGFGLAGWDFSAALDVQAELAERWDGIVHTDDGNQGRLDVLAGVGVSWSFRKDWFASASVKLPAYTYVVGGQLDYPAIGMLSFGARFGAWGAARGVAAEGDGQGDEPTPGDQPGDEPAAGDEPADPLALTPVPGVITVFDFWATWCEPCAELDAQLAALAARNPGRIVIKRVEVVTWKDPVAVRHLIPGGYTLPHIKVLRTDGTLVFEQSGDPTALTTRAAATLESK